MRIELVGDEVVGLVGLLGCRDVGMLGCWDYVWGYGEVRCVGGG